MGDKVFFSSPLTHSDWMLHKGGPAWGDDGIREMLTHCRDAGIYRIYWRVFDSGRSMYFSKLIDCMDYKVHDEPYQFSPGYIPFPTDPEIVERYNSLDYTGYDTLEAAVRIGHELGLEIWAWMTINEDDHGFGFTSRFSREHPEYRWVMRDGRVLHSQMSFAFPEVREYKKALVGEMLAYDIDGIFMDWLRTGDIRDNPHTDPEGIAAHGYEKPLVEEYIKRYGKDPHDNPNGDDAWVRLRVEPLTVFMRDVRKMVDAHTKKLGLSTMTANPWGYRGHLPEQTRPNTPQWVIDMNFGYTDGSLNGLLVDIKTWAREGLVDEADVAGYYRKPGTPLMAFDYLKNETEGRIKNVIYLWVPRSEAEVAKVLETAKEAGADHVLLWEADYIDSQPEPLRSATLKAMREAALEKCP